MRFELRTDQHEVIGALRSAVAERKRRICMQAPTGIGKTVIASAITESARAKGKKVLFTVPAISLVDQTVQMFYSQGIYDVGVIQASHHMTDWSKPVQVASIQTLMKRELPQADIVLLDEVHKWFSFYEKWLSKDHMPAWANVPMIGLSATPWTKGLGSWFDHFYRAATTQEMIDAGHLSPFEVYAPDHPELDDIKTVGGDYHEGQLSERMSQPKLVGDAVKTWQELWGRDKTLCYAVDRAHARHLQEKFEAAGVPCAYQDAFTKDDERARIKSAFHSGEVKVVVNIGTLTVGIDWDVRCISMNRPTKSDMLFVQIVGRGLRLAPPGSEPKDHCLILDHSDNHNRLGKVTDIDVSYVGLHDGKTPAHSNRTEAIRLPKDCPSCHYLKPPRMAVCPMCGFKAEVQCTVLVEAGELRILKPKPKKAKVAGEPVTHQDKLVFYAELRGHELMRGYRTGWAANQYRERIGTWPAHDMKHVQPINPGKATASWIKSRMIAFVRGKAKAAPIIGTGGSEAHPLKVAFGPER
ncbi:MAG TPA: DEAD/DEAH box helicase [Casimicrobiaceae bacterium]|jgi:superfamily II DNA or RNA helicase|nr:DEAD/DEAH box helicase [Casimicrobiaceae bacterium]